jgi:hypothetical protein
VSTTTFAGVPKQPEAAQHARQRGAVSGRAEDLAEGDGGKVDQGLNRKVTVEEFLRRDVPGTEPLLAEFLDPPSRLSRFSKELIGILPQRTRVQTIPLSA